MNWKLFLDDERDVRILYPNNHDEFLVARNLKEAIMLIDELGCPEFVSFDHDLGVNETGYELAQFLIKLDLDMYGKFIPKMFDFHVHSANPVGRSNIVNLLDNYLDKKEV